MYCRVVNFLFYNVVIEGETTKCTLLATMPSFDLGNTSQYFHWQS